LVRVYYLLSRISLSSILRLSLVVRSLTMTANGRQYDKCGTRLHCIFKPAQIYIKIPNVSTFTQTPHLLYCLLALGEAQSSQITLVNVSFRASIKSFSSSENPPPGEREAFRRSLMSNGRQYDKCGTRLHCIFKPAQMYLKFSNVSTFTRNPHLLYCLL